MKILVINGPNLNMLGKREPHIYGNATLDDLISFIKDTFRENFEIELVINPGAFSHYSYAIYDAIKSININCVEVHISNIHQRQEEFRKKSVTAGACIGQISGFGFYGYILAINALVNSI